MKLVFVLKIFVCLAICLSTTTTASAQSDVDPSLNEDFNHDISSIEHHQLKKHKPASHLVSVNCSFKSV